MDIQKLTKNKFGFTLVELIVVITIIAILGTIAFIYFGVHNKNSRDTVRISDIKNIEKGLGIYIAEKGFYPEPDSGVNITYSGGLAWTQGIVGENLLRGIEMTKVFDPLTSNPYTYSVTSPKNGYQIGAIREGNVAQSFNLVNKTYALEKTAYALIRGTYNQRVIRVSSGSTDFILAVPSIITSDLNNTDLGSIISNKLLVFSNYRNIPSSYQNMGYTMTGGFDFIHGRDILIFSGSLYDASTDLNRLMILNGVKNAYKGTIIGSSYNDIINLDISTNQKQALLLTNSFKNIVGEYKEKLLTGSYYYQLSAGYRHTCGIKVGDKLYCWGLNSNGQLGDNTTIQKNGPTLVYSGSDFIQVSTNYIHTCAIKTDGKLYCWGYNGNGRLGDNTTSQRNLPTLINSGSTYKQISVGGNHTCGIKSNNKLFCWGYNNYGQLGDGTIVQKLSPVPIDSANDYIQVRAGGNSSGGHTCAIRSDGKLYCWGYNGNGQLGDNSTIQKTSPVAIDTINSYSQIITGANYTCGIRIDGKLYCWGYNGNGQLGRGNTAQSNIPVWINSGSLFKNITTTYGNHTCGIKTDGKLYCWGYNNYSQLGDGTMTQRTLPFAIDPLNSYSLITNGESHTCGMKKDGKLFCWGNNGNGQLGYGVEIDKVIPSGVDLNNYKELAVGLNHNCSIGIDDKLNCWGYNGNGQIGDNTIVNKFSLTNIDVGINYSKISAGNNYTCGIRSDGKLYCWGYNGYGQLGRGNTSQSNIPVWIASGSTFIKVSTSLYYNHTCGIRSDGKLYCWGLNNYGQLGDGTTIQKNSPVAIDSTNTYKDIVVGYTHSCAIRSNDKLYCWGYNSSYQLGDGTNVQRTSPVAIDSTNTYKKVTAGYQYTCAIRSNDKLYCWGYNGYSQLGDGTSTQKNILTQINSGSTYKSIVAGVYHTCGIKTDDSLYCWGYNSRGQLGNGTIINRSLPTLIDTGSTYISVGVGSEHTCGMKSDGKLYCWGYNQFGQLGLSSSNSTSPGAIN